MFSFFGGRGLVTLQQGDVIHNFSSIQQDIFLTAYASFVCELLDKATEERQKNEYLFELAYAILRDIDEGYDAQILTQIFEMKMLNLLGLYPVMDRALFVAKRKDILTFLVQVTELVCHRCFERDPYRMHLPENVVKLLRLFYMFRIDRLGEIHVKPETKAWLEKAIDTYYDEKSGLYLKSKKFLRDMSKWSGILEKKDED
ncbi:DNA repair protein RecO [Listeria aquatica]|uniref:DNA repair protein RecO n=1 Tax=Listeria aquatica TaxID=1494960 RepID=UPI0031F4ECE7